jgi:hypothetical protein
MSTALLRHETMADSGNPLDTPTPLGESAQMSGLLEDFANGVSGVAAFVGGSATGAGLGVVLEWPWRCEGAVTALKCTNIIGMTPDKEVAAVLVTGTGLILGLLASLLRSIGEEQARKRSARDNPFRP